jgi:hypothetical protein
MSNKNIINPRLYRNFYDSDLDLLRYYMVNLDDLCESEILNQDPDDNSFEAIVISGLYSEDNSGASLDSFDGQVIDGFLHVFVFPLSRSRAILGDPRQASNKEEAIEILRRYKNVYYAKSQFYSLNKTSIPFGQKVICRFLDGSFQQGNERNLVFELPTGLDIDTSFERLKLLGFNIKTSDYFISSNPILMGNYGPNNWDEKYKNVIIQGSVFPDDPIRDDKKIHLRKEIVEEYLPALEIACPNETRGMKLFITAHAIKEGFYRNTRAYRYNNPGNIGNTDSGNNVGYATLEEGIKKQVSYVNLVAQGKHRSYKLGKEKKIKPYFSKEIALNQKSYKGKSPYLPGYNFIYTGQLDQYVKIYATGSRSGNSYLSLIISFFKQNGITITAQSKVQDIIKLN